MIFTQTIEKMKPDDMLPFRVTFGKLKDQLETDFISGHFIIVEVVTKQISCSELDHICDDPLDLKGTFFKAGRNESEGTKFVTDSASSKPLKHTDGKYYYYLIYDLCYVTSESLLQITIDKQTGVHSIEIKVHIDEILDFDVNCVDPDSDMFVSKKYH